MIEFVLSAPASGSGKTVMTCALLGALKMQGLDPCAFKCGPDYIDPMFHRAALGVQSGNLDLYLAPPQTVRALYARGAAGHGAAVCEGAMGLYDGVGGTTARASAWDLARVLHLPVVLTVRAHGASLTLAAQLKGLCTFRPDSRVAGFLLNECSAAQYSVLAPMLERETGLAALGYLPHMPQAVLESRHLGLYTAGEIADLAPRLQALAEQACRSIDFARLAQVCTRTAPLAAADAPSARAQGEPVPIAVARDEAFCFAYAQTLDALRDAGAQLLFFSPLRERALPQNARGLYLPGGYPELHADALAANASMRRAVRAAAEAGMPTVAECGGFLYLGQSLTDAQGRAWPMAGVLPGRAFGEKHLVRFGYAELCAKSDSMLFLKGEKVPVHEFHYWDSTENGGDFSAVKPVSGRQWQCGFAGPGLYAGFPHLYFAGEAPLAQRFVQAARRWQPGGEETNGQ